MRVIALMPVRNEAWIIERTLTALSTFCDRIIVADQRSTDGTRDILKKFIPKVVLMDNPAPHWSERIRWRLLEAARGYDGNHLIFCVDADELFSANILTGNHVDRLASLPPGTAFSVELVQLWRSPRFWRVDPTALTGNWLKTGFRDDRLVQYKALQQTEIHEPRLPACPREERCDKLKLLHFQFVLYERQRSKQCWYRILEATKLGMAKAADINDYYRVTRDERQVRLSPLDPEWVTGWRELGLDLEHFEEEPLYWYDVEVLRWFREKGPAYFAPLDLWDVDWEHKRQLALSQGYEGIPEDPIRDPRTWEQKLYHAYLARFQRRPFWRDPADLLRLADQGLRSLAKGLGLRRSRLERLGLLKPRPLE